MVQRIAPPHNNVFCACFQPFMLENNEQHKERMPPPWVSCWVSGTQHVPMATTFRLQDFWSRRLSGETQSRERGSNPRLIAGERDPTIGQTIIPACGRAKTSNARPCPVLWGRAVSRDSGLAGSCTRISGLPDRCLPVGRQAQIPPSYHRTRRGRDLVRLRRAGCLRYTCFFSYVHRGSFLRT